MGEKPGSSGEKTGPKFEMPGQTKELNPVAPDAEALKIFYKTLHEQRPNSEMAQRFLLQHGPF